MKKHIHTFLFSFLCLTVLGLLFLQPVQAEAATIDSGTCGENLTWTLDDQGTLTISGAGPMTDSLFDTPWNNAEESITAAVIENGVTSIGEFAFYSCYNLASVSIPDSIVTIGSDAFAYCSRLTNITLPDSVTSIGRYAFSDCSKLSSVTIPVNVTTIEVGVFSGCTSLTNVAIPVGVTTIENSAFGVCSSLSYILYGGTQEQWNQMSIDDFKNEYLEQAALHPQAAYVKEKTSCDIMQLSCSHCQKTVGYSLIDGATHTYENGICTVCGMPEGILYTTVGFTIKVTDYIGSAASVTIPEKVGELPVAIIGESSFRASEGLVDVVLPDSVTDIAYDAFGDCIDLQTIVMPTNLQKVGEVAFDNCENLNAVYISNIAGWCSVDFYEEDDWAAIESNPLYYAGNLYLNGELVEQLVIPDGVERISDSAFIGGTCLTAVTIPDSVISIGNYAFFRCENLETVTIGRGVTSIGRDAFYGCSRLKRFYVDESNSAYSTDTYGVLCNKNKTELLVFPQGYVGSYEIPEGLTDIGYSMFEYCEGLTSITVPDSVTGIEDRAFYGCSNLKDITIGSNVASIGEYAFIGCSSLESICVDEENSVYSNDEYGVLYDKEKTTLLCFPYAYTGSYKIPQGVTRLSDSVFSQCEGLTSITIPDSITSIDEWLFSHCIGLTSVTLPESITSIGEYAFTGCESLTTVYYNGTQEQYERITIMDGNEVLRQVSVCYNFTDFVPGDFDGNSELSDADALYLLRFTLFPERYPVEADADVNSDGQVNDADALYLLRHTLFADRYPLYPKENEL